MSKYMVVRKFYDSPHDHTYEIGSTYPIDGMKVTKKRLNVLSSTNNKYNEVYIELSSVKED